METAGDPAGRSVMVRGLACGAPHHLYLTAFNTHGTSAPSPVLVTSTLGSREYLPWPHTRHHTTLMIQPVPLNNTIRQLTHALTPTAPGRPNPASLVEVNATCVTLRLYVWPEHGCPITHWKVRHGTIRCPTLDI